MGRSSPPSDPLASGGGSRATAQASRGTPHRLDLRPTHELHKRLEQDLSSRGADYARELRNAHQTLHDQQITFSGARDIPTGLTALLLKPLDVAALESAAGMAFQLVEKTLNWLAESPPRIAEFFPHLARIVPHLFSTAGWSGKQVVSRYDAVVTPSGELKIIELNTCCPAGFLHSEAFCDVTQRALGALESDAGYALLRPGAIRPSAVVDGLLEIERSSGIAPRMIAALTDENEIRHELDLLLAAMRRKTTRRVEIVDARRLDYDGGRLSYQGEPISLTYNKFRISVPGSQNHCWRPGFEERYAAFLQAAREGAVVSVNNLFGMAVGEDKGMLALWSQPEFLSQLTPAERDFVARHVAWTRPLVASEVEWNGRSIRLPEFLYENSEHFVIKPAGEGRGFGVVIGRYADRETWQAACQPDPATPCIVQEFIEPVRFPVIARRGNETIVEPMFLTVALATVCGRYQGILSRVSSQPVTNVARAGMVQAVLVSR